MPIVYLNGKFTAQRLTGVQRVADRMVRSLDRRSGPPGWRWVLVCPPHDRLPSLDSIEVRAVGPRGLPLHLWEQAVLPWVARDGVLVNMAGTAPWLASRPVVMMHDAAVFDHPEAYTPAFVAWYRGLFRRLARSARSLVTGSAFSRERLSRVLEVPEERFQVIAYGADHLDEVVPDLDVLGRQGLLGTRFLLAVASANPTKNLPALLAAFARLRPDPALRLVVVGGGNPRVFAADAATHDPPGVVRTGPLDDAALKALYQHAHALIFPSVYEGFGLPPLEAMACGCPVAVARAASLPEVCGDAVLYFDPRSVPDLAATIQRLLDDAPLRESLRAAGDRHVKRYRWRFAADELAKAIERCA